MINLTIPGFQLISGYPLWFAPLCLLFGAGVAVLLYYKNTAEDFPRSLVIFLSVLRFLSASLIAFLLLSPMIKTTSRTAELPAVIIGVDNSRSMVLGADSLFQQNQLPLMLSELGKELKGKFEVYSYTFGQQVAESEAGDYQDELSDIASFFSEINARFYNRNVGAVVLVSDGIYNAGKDPLYASRDAAYPVYTINAGDTTVKRDLVIQRVNYNRTAFKGNRFPVEVVVQAREAGGMNTELKVTSEGRDVYSAKLDFTSDNQVRTISFTTEALETGIKKFRIAVDVVDGEVNKANNVREIFIEVKEGKQRIAIVGSAPHPDLAALERAIDNGNNFEADLFYTDNLKTAPSGYNLFILHQVPSLTNAAVSLTTALAGQKVPVLFVLGAQSDIPAFNRLKTGLSLIGQGKSGNEALPVFNKDFTLFVTPEHITSLLATVPPLLSPFAQYQQSNSVNVLAYQGLGSLRSEMPLILFSQIADTRYGIIAGEGLWKWRMHDFQINGNHSAFDEFTGKLLQYLSAETDRNRLKLTWRNTYAENEPVEFNALLLNESGEIVNDPEIDLTITGEDDKVYDFLFSAMNEGYYLNAGNLPPGLYRFTATSGSGDTGFRRDGSFTVTAINLEDVNTIANHRLLNAIAAQTGGKSLKPEETGELSALINNREDAKPVIYSRKHFTDLISFIPLLGLIILVLGTEWFLRRFNGSY